MGQLYGCAVPAAGRNSAVLVYSSSQAEAGAKFGLACRCHAYHPPVCRSRVHAQLNQLSPSYPSLSVPIVSYSAVVHAGLLEDLLL